MKRRSSSIDSDSRHVGSQDSIKNIRTNPPHIYDHLTRRLLKFGITLSITTFIGLIVRYAVHEFDPSVSTITVTTSQVDNRDIASLSVSKYFLERILEFVEESIAIVAAIIPIGFPLCSAFNKYFAKVRAGSARMEISNEQVLDTIPKYVVIGDTQACQVPNTSRLRPLVRDTIYHLIKAHLKPKLISEDSYEEARKFGIRIGLIRRNHHKLAVIKSVDLLKLITDSRGDIKHGKFRYLLSRMKIMSQSTPADKSLLIYLMKHCESEPNENLIYLGHSFTDPEAMRIADCAIAFQDCDDEDVKKAAQVKIKSDSGYFTDLYLFVIVTLLCSNITQSYALYQVSASVSCCIYRFLSITVFQEQLISHSQFTLLVIIQQVFAILALKTKWLSSLPLATLRPNVAEMSHAATEDSVAAAGSGGQNQRSLASISNANGFAESSSLPVPTTETLGQQPTTSIRMQRIGDDTLGSSSSLDSSSLSSSAVEGDANFGADASPRRRSQMDISGARSPKRRHRRTISESSQHVHLTGIDLDVAVINSKLVTAYKQTFHNSTLIDDVTYRLVKLHITYQVLVMIVIMIFGNAMFQLNMNNNRQHQTLAFNSLMMNNIFNLANCFNQVGEFNLRSGLKNHPFFVCVLLLAVFTQISLTELNAFGLESLNPMQWFVCFVFALLSALIAPLTGQQQRQRDQKKLQQQSHPGPRVHHESHGSQQAYHRTKSPNSRSHSSQGRKTPTTPRKRAESPLAPAL